MSFLQPYELRPLHSFYLIQTVPILAFTLSAPIILNQFIKLPPIFYIPYSVISLAFQIQLFRKAYHSAKKLDDHFHNFQNDLWIRSLIEAGNAGEVGEGLLQSWVLRIMGKEWIDRNKGVKESCYVLDEMFKLPFVLPDWKDVGDIMRSGLKAIKTQPTKPPTSFASPPYELRMLIHKRTIEDYQTSPQITTNEMLIINSSEDPLAHLEAFKNQAEFPKMRELYFKDRLSRCFSGRV